MSEMLPFQKKYNNRLASTPMYLTSIERARAALPIFGGTSTETPTETTTTETTTTEKPASTTTTSATGEAEGETPPIDPKQVADLMSQIEGLTKQVSTLTTEKQKADTAKQAEDRAKMGREEALEADLEVAQQTIIKMDQALKRQAIVNAINGFDEIKFHDPSFVISKLDPSISENMIVDLDNSTVTVKGVENDLRRVAKEFDWAVKKGNVAPAGGNPAGGGRPSAPRGSGAPPGAAGSDPNKATRRKELAQKWPAIAHGRTNL